MMKLARRILIVDDTESDLAATRFLLERKRGAGYAIQEVAHGGLAEQACEKFQPDCVLLDYRMPDMDGLEVLGQLRRRFGALKFAVVLQTGLGNEGLAVRALKNGAQDYIPKNVSEDVLERVIQNALDKLELERQKREAEEVLVAKQRQMQDLLEGALCALYTVDLQEGRSVHVNAFCESLIGYTPQEIDYMGAASFLSLIHPSDRGTVQAHVRAIRLAADNEILECQFRIRHKKDGHWHRLSMRNRVISRDDKGFGIVAAGTATEIGNRSGLENEWGDTQTDLLAAQEAAGIAAWAWDVQAQVLDCSPLFRTLYGRGQDILLSADIFDEWIHPDDRESLTSELTRALAGQQLRTEFRTVWPDGSVHWLRAEGKLVNEDRRLLGILQDITESTTQIHRLRESNEELERFAYIASHDLQEPLRAVISFADLLGRRSKEADGESKQYLEFIRQGGARMQALVSDLLTFSRVMQTDHELMERVDCQQVISAVLEEMKPLIASSGAEIEVGALPVVLANPQQMAQLFENLLANAIKYRDSRSPSIKISAVKAGRDWRFCVSDNGIGFEMIYASRIFEAFKRLHSRSKYEGSGIGLALCKKILERHGGRIWAESELGVGSQFYFLIPDLT